MLVCLPFTIFVAGSEPLPFLPPQICSPYNPPLPSHAHLMFPHQCVTISYVPPVKLPKLLAVTLAFTLLTVLLFLSLSILQPSR